MASGTPRGQLVRETEVEGRNAEQAYDYDR